MSDTKPESPSEDADAAIDRMMMDRGAGRTVPMERADTLAAAEAECERLRVAIATQAAAVRTLKSSRDTLAARDQRILKSLEATDRASLLAEMDRVKEERDEWNARATELELTQESMAATLAGRAPPPTEAEMEAHRVSGGLWRWVSTKDGEVLPGCSYDGSGWVYGNPMGSLPKRIGSTYTTRYWALNAKRELCAWPKVTS